MKKSIAVVLSLMLLSSSVFGCSKTTAEPTSVTKGDVDIQLNEEGLIENTSDEWYLFNEYVLEEEYGGYDYSQVINTLIGIDGEEITTRIDGYEIVDRSQIYTDGYSREFCCIKKYNYTTGEILMETDLTDYSGYFEDENGQIETMFVGGGAVIDGCIYQIYRITNYTTASTEYHILVIDGETGEIVSDEISETLHDRFSSGELVFDSAVDGSKIVLYTGIYNSTPPLFRGQLRALQYDFETDETIAISIGATFTAQDAQTISGIKRISETKYAAIAYDALYVPIIVILDFETQEKEVLDFAEAMSDITDDLSGLEIDNPINMVSNDLAVKGDNYIAVLNPETMKFEKVFDTTHCNMNASIFDEQMGYIGKFDDRLIFANGLYSWDAIMGVYELQILDSNPYEGRQLLTVSALGKYLSPVEADAIYKYNDSQDEVFISIDNSYAIDDEDDDYYYNYGNYITSASVVTAQLAVDLMAGDGPDIILDASEFSELNKSDCLIDLMPYLEAGGYLNDDLYYSKAFEVSQNESGELYQVPLSFNLCGIDNSYGSGGNVGFTFDEYADFVYGECNGWNPLSHDRDKLSVFVLLFNNMDELFIANGIVDLDNEAFRTLAEYCFENVNDGWTYEDLEASGETSGHGVSTYFYPMLIGDGYMSFSGGETTLMGFPSIDGRGPLLRANNSVGISSGCDNVDAAIDFLNYLLSEEVQTEFESSSVNRAVVTNDMMDSIVSHNELNELWLAEDPTARVVYYDEDYINLELQIYEEIVDSVSGLYSGDSDVSAILFEEVAPYFAGDKTLDEIIPIIESRIQTVLNERG